MDEAGSDQRAGVSRRTVLTGASAALAGGLAAGAAMTVAGASTAAATGARAVAAGPPGTTVLEFICRINQSALTFDGMGYLTQVTGLGDSDLFTDPNHRDEAHALFVAVASGDLVARSVDGVVHSLDIDGKLRVFQRNGPGASWDNPASFTAGRQVARYSLDLQDVLTVINTTPPATGLPVLNGSAQQTDSGAVRGRPFGQVGQSLRFVATGLGTRSDGGGTDLSNVAALLSVAGSLIAV